MTERLTPAEALEYLLLTVPCPTSRDNHYHAWYEAERTLAIYQGRQDDAAMAERKLRLMNQAQPTKGLLTGSFSKNERNFIRLHGFDKFLQRERSKSFGPCLSAMAEPEVQP